MQINYILKHLNSYRDSSSTCSQKSIVIALLFQQKEVSSIDMKNAGVMNPAQIIASLSKQGAIIKRLRKDVTDSSGRHYKRVSHYSLTGWSE